MICDGNRLVYRFFQPKYCGTKIPRLTLDTVKGPNEILDTLQPKDDRQTLSGAMKGHQCFDDAKSDLWRLLVHLRVAPHGCDKKIVKNHLLVRGRITKSIQKWQNLVGHQLALERNQKVQGVLKQSRQSAWISHCEKVRSEYGSGLPSCVVLHTGHCVAVWFLGEWRVAIVLSIWRHYKKNSGAQLYSQEIGRGGIHSARVLLATQPNPEMPALFVANAACTAVVVSATSIGLRLDTDSWDCKRASDTMKFVLPEAEYA